MMISRISGYTPTGYNTPISYTKSQTQSFGVKLTKIPDPDKTDTDKIEKRLEKLRGNNDNIYYEKNSDNNYIIKSSYLRTGKSKPSIYPNRSNIPKKHINKISQSAPTSPLPETIDKSVEDKIVAETIVFGNETLNAVKPEIVHKAIKNLSNYFSKQIKETDLQVIRDSKGVYIGYFDKKTNLSTCCSYEGNLNVQYKIKIDKQGQIRSYDLYSSYGLDGKFTKH